MGSSNSGFVISDSAKQNPVAGNAASPNHQSPVTNHQSLKNKSVSDIASDITYAFIVSGDQSKACPAAIPPYFPAASFTISTACLAHLTRSSIT